MTFYRDLTEKEVASSREVFKLTRRATSKRNIGETRMNKSSSRSHFIFTMRVQSKVRLDGNQIMRNGKLHVADLAGIEGNKSATLEKTCRVS